MLDIPNIRVKSICSRAEVHSNESDVYSLNKRQEKMQNCEDFMYFLVFGFGIRIIVDCTAHPAQNK